MIFYYVPHSLFSGIHTFIFSLPAAGFSRALGCRARKGPACTPRRRFGSRSGSVERDPGVQADNYRSRKHNRNFQHFGRLFLPGTLKNVPCCLNELLVNFREESSGIGRFCRLEVPTDGQQAQFRFFNRNRVNCTKQAACLVLRIILPVSIFLSKLGQLAIRWNSSL